MLNLFRNIGYYLTKKRIKEDDFERASVSVVKSAVSYFNLSTNSIIALEHNGKICFFRECHRVESKLDAMKSAVSKFLSSLGSNSLNKDFFLQDIPIRLDFSDEEISIFENYITNRMMDRIFLKRLANYDHISKKMNFSIWSKNEFTSRFFDLYALTELPEAARDIAVYFIWCIRGAALNLRTQKIVRGEQYSFFGAVRAMASWIVAKHLGIAHMITKTCFCELDIAGSFGMFGTISDAAPGVRMIDTSVPMSGELQRELVNLNALDLILYQVDHGINNYNVYINGDTVSVCAFDNDNPTTLFPTRNIKRSFSGCSPLINKNGFIDRPYFDRDLAERINNIDTSSLKKELKPYLNFIQISALISRIKQLNCAIKKTESMHHGFLLSADSWSVQTALDEINGAYGVTYLTRALRTKV